LILTRISLNLSVGSTLHMRALMSFLVVAAAVGGAAIWAAPGCGSTTTSGFGGPNGDNDSGTGDQDGDCTATGTCFNNSDAGDGVAPCVGLECQIVNCSNGSHTTISGTVYDPAGRNPLYNVYVYIPNAPLLDIPSGPVCTSCQAPASGSPLPGGVQTDPKGHFQLVDVPVGTNIPLVMQLGKFRRKIAIPTVSQCVDNPIGKKDSSGNEMLTRLARKQHESDMADNIPKIAIATGSCDSLECLIRKIGIDDTEFTNAATGRVHIFTGSGGASAGYSTDAQTTLWSQAAVLKNYDIVVNSCECSPIDRQGAYTVMHNYVDGGGRLFGTHYHYNWFAPPTGPADYNSVAQWLTSSGTFPAAPWYIDTTFPKGVAFDQWVQNVFKSNSPPPPGQINLTYSNSDVANVNKPLSTRWIYYGDKTGSNYGTAYLSFNTPVKAPVTSQCGRAVFSDLHVGSSSTGGTFPNECDTTPLTQQEAALEFLFFDLSACVQDDSKPPPPPPPN